MEACAAQIFSEKVSSASLRLCGEASGFLGVRQEEEFSRGGAEARRNLRKRVLGILCVSAALRGTSVFLGEREEKNFFARRGRGAEKSSEEGILCGENFDGCARGLGVGFLAVFSG
jgi:hypothetical protein